MNEKTELSLSEHISHLFTPSQMQHTHILEKHDLCILAYNLNLT